MSNYYTHFSFTMPLPSTEAQSYAVYVFNMMEELRNDRDETAPIDWGQIPEDLQDEELLDNWCFNVSIDNNSEINGLWFHSEDGGVDPVAEFVQHLLKQFDPSGVVGFEWSTTCDKPRTDAFGGGAIAITATATSHINTAVWLDNKMGEMKAALVATQAPATA